MKLPKFTYFPDPLVAGSVKESNELCACCGKQNGYIYTSSYYGDDIGNICPWCIDNGMAAKKYHIHFNAFGDFYTDESDQIHTPFNTFNLSKDIETEISQRTPGFSCFQQEAWKIHCHDGCEFHGLATVKDIQSISDTERQHFMQTNGLSSDDLKAMQNGIPDEFLTYCFKFICRHCNEILLMMDMD